LNTVTYDHEGIREWYANGPLGIEQGFTINRRPAGAGELTLVAGRVPRGTRTALAAGRGELTIVTRRGSLRYSDLRVTDAAGQYVPAEIQVSAGRILIRVADAFGRYPLRVDPSVETGGAELEAPSAGNGLASVAMSEDGKTVVAGGSGAAYVFTEPANGGWQNANPTAELTENGTASQDGFGNSVAISGDGSTIVVGAPGTSTTAGAAYVFTEPISGGWENATAAGELTDANVGDNFGVSVAMSADGRSLVVGAPNWPAGSGAAYVFSEPTSGGWQDTPPTAELTENSGISSDSFGRSVALSADGTTTVVGAPDWPVGNGAAYVFIEPASGGWRSSTQTARLIAVPPVSWSPTPFSFGYGVAASGDGSTIAVTTEGLSNGPYSSSASPFVFSEPESGGWQDQTTAQATDLSGGPLVALAQNGLTLVASVANTSLSFTGAAVVFSLPVESGAVSPVSVQGPGSGAALMSTTSGVAISGDGSTVAVTGSSDTVLVFPPPPVASSPPTVSGIPRQGQTLTESHGLWSNDPTGYSYQWEQCNSAGTGCAPIAGASGQSYTLTNADAGKTVAVEETATNISGASGSAVASDPTAVVIPLVPASSTVPVISGTAVEGNPLKASVVSWTNRPTTISYQWEDCDANGQNCQPIAGATAQSYTLASTDIGARIVVQESAANAGGQSSPIASAPTAAVPESGPVGLEIDNGDYATNNPTVSVEPVWPAGAQSVLISNNGGFRTNTQSFAPAATITWKLLQTGNDRLPKTVYVRFLGVGQDDINFTDDIILDETAPTIQSATLIGGGASQASAARAPKLHTYKLHLKATDKLVGVCNVATNGSRSTHGQNLVQLTSCKARGIVKLSRTLNLKLAARPRFVRVRNSAGDWSHWLAVS
jgi:hypothetical protein